MVTRAMSMANSAAGANARRWRASSPALGCADRADSFPFAESVAGPTSVVGRAETAVSCTGGAGIVEAVWGWPGAGIAAAVGGWPGGVGISAAVGDWPGSVGIAAGIQGSTAGAGLVESVMGWTGAVELVEPVALRPGAVVPAEPVAGWAGAVAAAETGDAGWPGIGLAAAGTGWPLDSNSLTEWAVARDVPNSCASGRG